MSRAVRLCQVKLSLNLWVISGSTARIFAGLVAFAVSTCTCCSTRARVLLFRRVRITFAFFCSSARDSESCSHLQPCLTWCGSFGAQSRDPVGFLPVSADKGTVTLLSLLR